MEESLDVLRVEERGDSCCRPWLNRVFGNIAIKQYLRLSEVESEIILKLVVRLLQIHSKLRLAIE